MLQDEMPLLLNGFVLWIIHCLFACPKGEGSYRRILQQAPTVLKSRTFQERSCPSHRLAMTSCLVAPVWCTIFPSSNSFTGAYFRAPAELRARCRRRPKPNSGNATVLAGGRATTIFRRPRFSSLFYFTLLFWKMRTTLEKGNWGPTPQPPSTQSFICLNPVQASPAGRRRPLSIFGCSPRGHSGILMSPNPWLIGPRHWAVKVGDRSPMTKGPLLDPFMLF
ncbi:hypothetical protein BKA70DRAFT_770944 [Coprinopsis sp. MPI-PUGE-AT-0042]|nr:hypothetical protein BKA70DRAFT_770944 [Coprinopsis sp. MPI-PUGE-AT-0042]